MALILANLLITGLTQRTQSTTVYHYYDDDQAMDVTLSIGDYNSQLMKAWDDDIFWDDYSVIQGFEGPYSFPIMKQCRKTQRGNLCGCASSIFYGVHRCHIESDNAGTSGVHSAHILVYIIIIMVLQITRTQNCLHRVLSTIKIDQILSSYQ